MIAPVAALCGFLAGALSPPQIVAFPSGKLTLHGVLYKPPGAGPFPAIVYNHGSGQNNDDAFAALAPVFLAHGWVFFAPSRRGQGLSADAGTYIMNEVRAARATAGVDAAIAIMVKRHEADLDDQLAALAWLRAQPYVDKTRVAVGGNSFGGIQAVLGAEKGDYCAALDAAGGAMSWASAPLLQQRLERAVRAARAPIFFFQAENDYDLAPSKVLSAAMKDAGKPYELELYPAYGKSPQEGHSFAYKGVDAWAPHAFRFLDAHCAKKP